MVPLIIYYAPNSPPTLFIIYYETQRTKKIIKTNMSKIISRSRTINYVVVTFQSIL